MRALPYYYIRLGSFLAIEKLMHCGSIMNKATGQVCRPAEKKTAGKKTRQHKSKWNRLLPTQDMYLQFIRSNIGANGNTNGNRSNFSSRVKTCLLPGRAPILIFYRT